jgi:hypothetical protein
LIVGKKKRLKAGKRRSPLIAVDYSWPAFAAVNAHLAQQRYNPRSTHSVRERFWSLVPNRQFAGIDAQEIVQRYLQVVEEELAEIVTAHSVAYWLHITRRVPPGPAGENGTPMTNGWVRSTFEAAFHKYAGLKAPLDVVSSRAVSVDRVLSGILLAPEFKLFRNQVEQGPAQTVIFEFGPEEGLQLYEGFKLSYEIWKSMAVLRAISKGATLVTRRDPPFFFDDRTDELDGLIRSYDDRLATPDASATGAVFSREIAANPADTSLILLPIWNLQRHGPEMMNTWLKQTKLELPKDFVPNFLWLPFALEVFYQAHRLFEDEFQKKHGVGLAEVLAVLATLSFETVGQWSGSGSFLHDWQRAYAGPYQRKEIINDLQADLAIALEKCALPITPSDVRVEKVFDFLALTDGARNSVSLGLAGPLAVFIPSIDDRFNIDLAHLRRRLFYFFHGLKPRDDGLKGILLEQLVRAGGDPVLPHEELHAHDGTAKQVDAAFATNGTLIIVECRAVGISIGFERGDIASVQFRNALIERTLDDIDDKARWLREHPAGKNYNVGMYDRILPIGVTPFPEFIPSRAPRYWVGDNLPRVMTAEQLQDALASGVFVKTERLSKVAVPLA